MKFDEPFFAFINIMEAHEPYHFGEEKSIRDVLPLSILERPSAATEWKKAYRLNANIAVKRLLDIVESFRNENTLVIVTSDHGQLLGEKNRYGHGYFLEEELLRVPLYIKYPPQINPFPQTHPFVSLTDINKVIMNAIRSNNVEVGSDIVLAESFGSQNDLSRFTDDRGIFNAVYSRRVRVFSVRGSVLYNASNDVIEENERGLMPEEISKMIELAKSVPKVSPHIEPPQQPRPYSRKEEELVIRRLKAFGYE